MSPGKRACLTASARNITSYRHLSSQRSVALLLRLPILASLDFPSFGIPGNSPLLASASRPRDLAVDGRRHSPVPALCPCATVGNDKRRARFTPRTATSPFTRSAYSTQRCSCLLFLPQTELNCRVELNRDAVPGAILIPDDDVDTCNLLLNRMAVARPFHASSIHLHLHGLLQFSTALRATAHRLSHPARVVTPARLTLNFTMSSRRSVRLSARAQVQAEGKDAPSAVMPPVSASAPATKSRKRKAPQPTSAEDEVPTEAPATPKRRAKKTAVPSLPSTPTATPSAVRLIAEPAATPTSTPAASSSVTPKPKPRAVARLADQNLTNAPLLSPETSRVVSYNLTTTASILEEACAHLIKGKLFSGVTSLPLVRAVFGRGLGFLLHRFHMPPQDLYSGQKPADPPQSDHAAI